jgi:CRP-like cAMP-binding protein
LPWLTHEQMLKATQNLQQRHYSPGETILRPGQHNDHFYIISKGQTDVLLHSTDGQQMPIARLGPGQYFGEMSLLDHSATNASVQATPDEPVQVVALERGIFDELMNEAQAMRQALMRVVYERHAQNAVALAGRTGRTRSRARGGLRAQTSLA